MMTKPDRECVLADLKDLSVLPNGWCMIIRDPMFVGDVESFGIKYLGGFDPLQQIVQLEAENKKLREFYEASCAVEEQILDFDLHNDAVERLRKAMTAMKESVSE